MTEPSRICAWMTWGSMWNLIIEIRKSTTHSLVPYPAYLSQWSLTFEVRKRMPYRCEAVACWPSRNGA